MPWRNYPPPKKKNKNTMKQELDTENNLQHMHKKRVMVFTEDNQQKSDAFTRLMVHITQLFTDSLIY